jgi:hypothetical protein
MVTFRPKGNYDQALTYIESIRTEVNKIESRHEGFYVAELGSVTTEKDSSAAIDGMLAKAGMIALPLALLILLFVFGSAVAALVPLLLAITAVAATNCLIALRASSSPWTSRSPRSSSSSVSPSASTTRCSTSGASAKSVPPVVVSGRRSRPLQPPPVALSSSRASRS